mgnify:CR=1 FL=1
MPEAKQAMSWEELTKERNPFLFYAKHMPTLTGDDGRHGKAQCKVPKAPENLCRLADSYGECLTSDAHVALRTLGKLIEGYTSHDNPIYEDDPMQALAGVGTLIRLLTDALEVGGDIQFHAAEGLYNHRAIQAVEVAS